LYDLDDADTTESALGEVSKSVQVGRNSLLAQVVEQVPEVLDAEMARLGGTVIRRPVYEIEDEIARAQEAQRDAKKQANAKLREARHEKTRAQAHAKVEELKSKLHLDRKPATTGS
jgi:parvulin-like peptidyl-prolyl isomerase